MIRKVINISAVFAFACFLCVDVSYAQAPHGIGTDDRGLAPHKGKALSVINVPSYTYIELEKKDGLIWIAAPTIEAKAGDRIWASMGIEMRDFYSKALNRTFPVIYFVGRAEAEGKGSKKIIKPEEHPEKEIEKPNISVAPEKGSIVRAEDGYTLEELFKKKERLGGKKVVLRGKVVKASGKIMGKRWFHLQDGTGSKGSLDLVLTSNNDANAGDIVLVEGVLGLNKNFGQGYKYDVIIEDAKITVE
ncbi:MAG: DNA-binding protein [bacterium]|nr:DNA-binding protein [bacterium]